MSPAVKLIDAQQPRHPQPFQRFTGLTVEEFDQLATDMEPMWKAAERKRLTSRTRQRVVGGGGQYKRSMLQRQVARTLNVLSTLRDL